jgi:hypothetical protein
VAVHNERWAFIRTLLNNPNLSLTEENSFYLLKEAANFCEWDIVVDLIFNKVFAPKFF